MLRDTATDLKLLAVYDTKCSRLSSDEATKQANTAHAQPIAHTNVG